MGPNLLGVVGRPIASANAYPRYSKSLKSSDGRWTPALLDEFLRNPSAWAPGTTMTAEGISAPEECANIIAWMVSISDPCFTEGQHASDDPRTEYVSSSMYGLQVTRSKQKFGGRDGGIARLEDRVIVATGSGHLTSLDENFEIKPLSFKIPISLNQFRQQPQDLGSLGVFFAVKDVFVRKVNHKVELCASHHYWHEREKRTTLRLSFMSVDRSSFYIP